MATAGSNSCHSADKLNRANESGTPFFLRGVRGLRASAGGTKSCVRTYHSDYRARKLNPR
jgi:hypothetical protein